MSERGVDGRLLSLEGTINLLIYLSVALGVVLLPQLYLLVPSWLFLSVLGGWLAYVAVAILAARRHKFAYPLAFVLSILTLAVSLPQPEHQVFVYAGLSLASITFLTGSILQVALLILISIHFLRKRKKRSMPK
jgi:hypothetical protein